MEQKELELTDKKLQIIAAAENLFATTGFDGTSVRDIAKEANVNIAMISYYFGSKEKLLEAIFEKRFKETNLKLNEMVQNDQLSPIEKVYQLIESFIDRAFGNQRFHRIMMLEQISGRTSPILEFLLEYKKKNHELIHKLIHDGQKKGVFKKKIDITLMLLTMVGTLNQFIATQQFYRQVNDIQEMPDEVFQKMMKKKLTIHIKSLFKAVLTNEEV